MAPNHWSRLSKVWSLQEPPLSPSPEDVEVAESIARAWQDAHPTSRLHALLLGVTRELATMRWPRDTSLVAIDNSEAMIGALWPRDGVPPGSVAKLGDWRKVDRPAASVDVAVGDGSLTVIAYPGDYRTVLAELRRVLRPDGRVVLRVFARPEAREAVADVATALWSGRIAGVHALKWRLAMAVQPPAERAVAVADILRAFRAICPDSSRLARELGWRLETLATIEAYRDSPAVYSFPTLSEVRSLLTIHFVELACHVPSYELGDRCPTLVLGPRPPP